MRVRTYEDNFLGWRNELIRNISKQILCYFFLPAILFERRRPLTSPSRASGVVVGLEAVWAFRVAEDL